MKIRTAFVSNSSSSSFCALLLNKEDSRKVFATLGLVPNERGEILFENCEAIGLSMDDYGRWAFKNKGSLLLYNQQPDRVGFEVGYVLAKGNKTVNFLRKQLAKQVKEHFDVEVDEKTITMDWGELHS